MGRRAAQDHARDPTRELHREGERDPATRALPREHDRPGRRAVLALEPQERLTRWLGIATRVAGEAHHVVGPGHAVLRRVPARVHRRGREQRPASPTGQLRPGAGEDRVLGVAVVVEDDEQRRARLLPRQVARRPRVVLRAVVAREHALVERLPRRARAQGVDLGILAGDPQSRRRVAEAPVEGTRDPLERPVLVTIASEGAGDVVRAHRLLGHELEARLEVLAGLVPLLRLQATDPVLKALFVVAPRGRDQRKGGLVDHCARC